jgi:hypothetical protein
MPASRLDPTLLDETGAALAIGSLLLTSPLSHTWYGRWGASDDEARRRLPGDEIAEPPTLQTTRAITISAPPERVWPWIVQIGQEHAGLYSYTRLENLARCQMTNADQIVPEWQNPQVGEHVRLGPKGYPLYRIVAIDPCQALVMQACDPVKEAPGPASWVFILEALGDQSTRLITRSRNRYERSFANTLMWRGIVDPMHFVMERRMLLGIQARAIMPS